MSAAKLGLHPFTVVSNEPVADDLMKLVLEAPELAALIKAGQFVNLRVPGDSGELLRLPLSFSHADAAAGTVEIVYAVVGTGTRRLAQMGASACSDAVGPCGNPWPLAPGVGRACLVSGGVGVTPIVACARMLAEQGVAFDAVVGSQRASRLWGTDELSALGAGRVEITTDDGSLGLHGFTTDALAPLLAEFAYDVVYTCGPEPMMAGVARLAREAGCACWVSMERMMGCGFGACGTCNVAMADGSYKSCCKDGPVFDAQEVAW